MCVYKKHDKWQSASERTRFVANVKQMGYPTKVACGRSICKQVAAKIALVAHISAACGLEHAEQMANEIHA